MIELLHYIETSTDEVAYQSESELVQDLNERVKEIKRTEKARKDAMTLELRDQEKFEQGRAAGLEQGKAVGLKEGKAIGAEEASIRIAKGLLNRLDDEQIVEITGLTMKQVKALREKKL